MVRSRLGPPGRAEGRAMRRSPWWVVVVLGGVAAGGTAAPATRKGAVWQKQRTPTVDGLEIVGAHPQADGLEAAGTVQLTVTRLVVREARHAIRLTGRNRNVVIAHCHLYHNRGAG